MKIDTAMIDDRAVRSTYSPALAPMSILASRRVMAAEDIDFDIESIELALGQPESARNVTVRGADGEVRHVRVDDISAGRITPMLTLIRDRRR